jgi:hypothetical protein
MPTCEQKAAVLLYGVLVLASLQLHEEALGKKRERSPAVIQRDCLTSWIGLLMT